MISSPRSKIRVISIGIVIIAMVIVAKLYTVQIVKGEYYSDRASRQYISNGGEIYDRGSIYFTSKDGTEFGAAILKTGYTLALVPSEVIDEEELYIAINNIVPIEDKDGFIARASNRDRKWDEIATKLTEEEANALKQIELDGFRVSKYKWRSYPGERMAANAIGLIAYQGDEEAGRYGLERYYNDVLSRNEKKVSKSPFIDIFASVSNLIKKDERKEGDIVTSIEPEVQAYLDDQLIEITDKWNSELSGGVVIDPSNGEIVAMSVNPTFDPNNFSNENISVFNNPLVENVYEMGSIIKPLTMLMGIDSGVVTERTKYTDEGYLTLNESTISNHDGEARGEVLMQEVLSQSLNTGAAYIQSRVGNERFRDYVYEFGLAEETGIDLPNETKGLLGNLDSPRDIEYATASFGQGVAFTPIGTIKALSLLANGGRSITPHVAKEVKYDMGIDKEIFIEEPQQIIDERAAEVVTRMLVKVVDEALLDGEVTMPNYSIAAKTGTAQMPNLDEGGYYDDRFLHSFFGYFPAYNAKYLVFLYTVHPKEVRYSSQTLTYPFMNMAKFLINYYEIPPDRGELS